MKPLLLLFAAALYAQQAPPPPPPQSYPVTTTDDSGFEPIFDGKTLNGWEGDPKYWRVENGAMIGEITPETIVKYNTFLIWRGGVTKDFELKVEYRITAGGNSGVNYRSVEAAGREARAEGLPGRHRRPQSLHRPELRGARADVHRHARARSHAFRRARRREVIGTLGDAAALEAFIKSDEWNEYPPHRARQHDGAHLSTGT